MNRYYVYAWLREDGTPYYIGKGCGRRAWKKHKGYAERPPDSSRIVLLEENLTEEVALQREKDIIAQYGLKSNGGILHNQLEGGEKPPLNTGHSEETKQKIRDANRKTAENRDFSYLKGIKKTITPALLEAKKRGVKKCQRGPDGRFIKKEP